MPRKRPFEIKVQLSESERRELEKLSQHQRLTMAQTIRFAIETEYRRKVKAA